MKLYLSLLALAGNTGLPDGLPHGSREGSGHFRTSHGRGVRRMHRTQFPLSSDMIVVSKTDRPVPICHIN
jgi:hypothetical protein